MKKLLTILTANKILLLITAAVALAYLPFGDIYYENLATYDSGSAFLNGWSLWDGNSYVQIARDGYHGRYFAYFPLYPIVLKLVSFMTLGNYALAGLLLNLALSFVAAYLIFKICKLELKNKTAGIYANIFLFFFPTAFFLTALYGEALFLVLGASTIYFLRKKKWLWVALFAFLAAMTKEVGGMLVLPILYSVLKDRKSSNIEKLTALAAPALGTLAVLGIYYYTSGDPFIFLEKHSEFGKELSLPYVPIIHAIKNLNIYHGWNLVAFLFTAFLSYKAWKLLPKEYFWYLIAVLLPPLCSSNLEGYSRYLLVAFPIFIALAALNDKKAYKYITAGIYIIFTGLLLLFCARYVMGGTGNYPFG